MKNRVIVLGKNYSTTLGTIRGLGEQGCQVTAFFVCKNPMQGKIVSASRYVSRFTLLEKRDESFIIDTLIRTGKGETERLPLIATDDYTASLVDRHLNELAPYYLLPCSEKGEGTIVRLMDKAVQCELARSFGIRTARSWTLTWENGMYAIPSDMVYPCFFKPLMSVSGGKDGMVRCNSQTALRDGLAAFSRLGGVPVLVQEYLEIEDEYSVSGLCWGEQVYLPALLRKLRVCQAHRGTTVMGVIEPFDPESVTYRQLVRLLASLKLRCIVDVELFRCGGELFFNEINLRTSAVCYGIVAGGVNLPGLFVDAQLSGHFRPSAVNIRFGSRFLCEKAAWDDYLAGFLNRKELRQLYREADSYIIRNPGDPKPEAAFRMISQLRAWKKRLCA